MKDWYFWTVGLGKTLESPLGSKEIKPVNPKRNQPWIFVGRTDAEAPIFWSPNVKSWLTGKDFGARKDWGREEKGATEDEMGEWHRQRNGREFGQTLTNSEGQGSLVCCVHGVGNSWARLNSWTTTTLLPIISTFSFNSGKLHVISDVQVSIIFASFYFRPSWFSQGPWHLPISLPVYFQTAAWLFCFFLNPRLWSCHWQFNIFSGFSLSLKNFI